jgi:hypothetical protein
MPAKNSIAINYAKKDHHASECVIIWSFAASFNYCQAWNAFLIRFPQMKTINHVRTLSTMVQQAEKFTDIATQLLILQLMVSLAIFSYGVGGRESERVFQIFMHKMFSGKICSANNVPKEGRDSIPLY